MPGKLAMKKVQKANKKSNAKAAAKYAKSGSKSKGQGKAGKALNKKQIKKTSPKKKVAKKVKVFVDPITKSLNMVGKVLAADYAEIPAHKMLLSVYRPALSEPQDTRHAIHTGVTTMVLSHVEEVAELMKQKLVVDTAKLEEELPQEKEALDAKQNTLTGTLEKLQNEKQAMEATKSEKEVHLAEKKAGLASTEETTKNREQAFNLLERQLSDVTAMKDTPFTELIENPPQETKVCNKLIALVSKVGREILKVEEGLLTALPVALRKPAESRGTFDNLTLQEMNKSIVAYQEQATATLSERDTVLSTLESTIATFKTEVHDTEQELVDLKQQMEILESNIDLTSTALKEVVAHLKQHPKNLAAAQKAKTSSEGRVDNVKKALECLNALMARKSDEEFVEVDGSASVTSENSAEAQEEGSKSCPAVEETQEDSKTGPVEENDDNASMPSVVEEDQNMDGLAEEAVENGEWTNIHQQA